MMFGALMLVKAVGVDFVGKVGPISAYVFECAILA